MQLIEISGRQDFRSKLEKIMLKYEPHRLVFRGQVEDRPLMPTMFRGRGDIPSPGCIPSLTANWNVCATRLISRFKKKEPTNVEVQAVMQHYGYRSFFVDVTSDPEVALWFALHKFESGRTPLHVDRRLRSAVYQWSRYETRPSGYLYVIMLPPEHASDNRHLNLTEVMPTEAQRVHSQRAGAIFCTRASRSIDNLVVAKLRVIDDGWFSNSYQNVKTPKLFPPPSIDTFYRCLCTVPYFITSEMEMQKIEVGHPLLGFFPIYAESVKELVKEYVPLTRILGRARPGLEWNVSTAVMDFENKRVKARGATRVLLPSLMIQTIPLNAKPSEGLPTDCWPSANLLLEFEPEASLVSPSPKALQEIVRGIWVIVGTKTLMVAGIIDQFDKVSIGHECMYSLPRMSLISKRCECPDHAYELEVLRKTSELLDEGTVVLGKDELGYLKIEHKVAIKEEEQPKRKIEFNRVKHV